MSKEITHGVGGHVLADRSEPVEYAGVAQPFDAKQTTVYTYTNTLEPPPVKPAPNPRHSSKDANHRTPPDVVERARRVLGGFDLDPFSSAAANEVVKAREFFSGPDVTRGQGPHPLDAVDGFEENWQGRVFCNPPGGRGPKNQSNQKRAWFKLASEYVADQGEEVGVSSALFVCFSVELLQTTQVKTPKIDHVVEEHDGEYVQALLPLPLDFPICFPSRRVAYLTPDGRKSKSPPHASCLVLLPDRTRRVEMVSAFVREFSPLGRVVVPATWGVAEGGI